MALFDQRLALARQLRAGYTPRVTTLSDVMYGTPQAATRLNPAAQVGGLGELRQFAQTRFADAARQSEALRIAQGEQAKAQSGFRGLVGDVLSNPVAKAALKPLEILDIPRRAIISTVKEITDPTGQKSFSDWFDQVKDPSFGFGDITGDITGSKWANRAIGFAGDVLLDPTTYMTFGASAVLKKAGISATGAAGRYALAARVLEVTGDAAKAKVAAQKGLAVRKVLTAAEKEALKLERAGVYMFGKHLKARRIPLTEKLGEAAESGMARLRLAATATKVGGALQKGMTPKWLDSERLALLRGEVPDEQFAAKLSTVLARDAYRAAREEGTRVASAAFKKAFDASNIVDNADLRQKLHRFLEGVEQPLTDVEQRAFTAWKSAFDEVYDSIDARLKALVPEGDKYGFGRVERYFPHVVTEQGREWLSSGTRAAKEVLDVLGLDDVGPTTFFNPRRLVKDVEFFGVKLTDADLNVKRLNEIANEGGFVGNFFETDVLTAATRYVNDAGEQMGRIGAMGYLQEKDLLKHIDKRGVSDEEAIKTLQRQMKTAIEKDAAVRTKVVATAQDAANAIDKHIEETRKSAERLAKAGTAAAGKSADQLAKAAQVVDNAVNAHLAAVAELTSKKSELLESLDPNLDAALFDSVSDQYDEIIAQTEQNAALLREYQEMLPRIDAEAALRSESLKALAKDVKQAQTRLNVLERNLKEFTEYGNWFATVYDDAVSGGEVAGAKKTGVTRTVTQLKRMLTEADVEQTLGRRAATEGTFEDFLKTVAPVDPTIVRLLGGTRAMSKFEDLSIAKADELIRSGFASNSSTLNAMLGGAVYIAKVIYHFDGIDNVPQYMRGSLDEAIEAVSSLRDIARWDDLVASAPKRLQSFDALRNEWGVIVDEIQRDAEDLAFTIRKRDALWKQIDFYAEKRYKIEDRMDELIAEGRDQNDAVIIRMQRDIQYLYEQEKPYQERFAQYSQQIDALKSKEYRVVSKAERAGNLDVGELGFTTVRGTGTTLEDHLRDEFDAFGLLDPNLDVGFGRTAGEVTEELGQRLDRRAGRAERIAQQRKPVTTAEEAAAKQASYSYGTGPQASTRPDKMLVSTAGSQSTTISESRRIPFTKEHRQYQKVSDEGRKAEQVLGWLQSIRTVKPASRRGTGPVTKVPTGEKQFKAWAKNQTPDRLALLRDELTTKVAQGKNARYQLQRLGDPSAVWRVQGMTSREMRYEAIYKLEQFMIAQEVARRYSAIVSQFASYGVIPPERVLDDIMRGVRTRRAPAIRAREKAFSDAVVMLRSTGASFYNSMDSEEIYKQFVRNINSLYETLGDAAVEHLGPKILFTQNLPKMVAKIRSLDTAVEAELVGSAARKAALKERQNWYNTVGKTFYLQANPKSGKISMEEVERFIRRRTEEFNFTTPAKARESLSRVIQRLETEGRMTTRMAKLYRQVDDIDFSATRALMPEEGAKMFDVQDTPTWKIAALESAKKFLDDSLARLAAVPNDPKLVVSRAWREKYAASKQQFEKIQQQIVKFEASLRVAEADPLYVIGKQQKEEVEFLASMAHVRGWELTPDEWGGFGIVPDVSNDVQGTARLQQIIDGASAADTPFFVQRFRARQRPYGRKMTATEIDKTLGMEVYYEQVTSASQVKYGEQLYTAGTAGWERLGSKESMAEALGLQPYQPHPAQAARIEAATSEVQRIESQIKNLESAIRDGADAMRLQSNAAQTAKRDIGLYEGEMAGPISDVVVINGMVMPRTDFERQLAEMNTQRISLLNERERALAVLGKEQSFDSIRRTQWNKELDEALANADPLKVRVRKVAKPQRALRGRGGKFFSRADMVQPESEMFDTIYERFGLVGTDYVPIQQFKDPRNPSVVLQFSEQEWRSLFVPTITPENAAENAKRAAVAQKKADAISKEIADTLERRASLAGSKTRVDVVLATIDVKVDGLRLELAELNQKMASGVTPEVQAEARKKFDALFAGYKRTYTNGVDDVRYQGALRVVSDGGKADVDNRIISARADSVRKAFAATKEARAVAKRDRIAVAGNSLVRNAKRLDIPTQVWNLNRILKQIDKHLAVGLDREAEILNRIREPLVAATRSEAKVKAETIWQNMLEAELRDDNIIKEAASPAIAEFVRKQKKTAGPRIAELEARRTQLRSLGRDLTETEAADLDRLKNLGSPENLRAIARDRITASYERDKASFIDNFVNDAIERFVKKEKIDLANPEDAVKKAIASINAQIEEQRLLQGTLRGSKETRPIPEHLAEMQGLVDVARAKKTDLETKQTTLTTELERIAANRKEVVARKNAAERRVNAQQRQIIKKDMQALVEHEATQKSALAARRADAEKAVDKAQQGVDKAQQAVEKARLKYDQVAAAGGGGDKLVAAQQLRDSIDSIESIIATRIAAGGTPDLLFGIPEGAMADGVLKRVAKAKKYAKADRKVLEAKVRAGETAAAQLAKGGISDAKRVTLEKAVAAGDAAAETLRAVSMTDAEALQLLGMYNEILTVQNLPEGDPLRKILEKAVAAETEFLASARATEEAFRSLDMGMLFSTKMVDDINEGWKELSGWGLPTMQAPEIVVDMLNNVNRLRSQGVMKELNDLVHRYTRFFKAYATLSPGFHLRNAMSNTLMVYMAGADVGNMRRGLSLYNDWLRASREGLESKWREGLDAEERALFDQALRITDAAGGGATTEMFRGVRVDDPTAGRITANRLTRGSQRVGSRVDGSGRFMLAFDSVAKGADFHSGTARVKRYLFDYTDTNRIDDAMRDIVPFWIWMSRNMPMQIINQWQNPKGYALYASLMRNVSENEDDGEIVPSWLKESGAAKISSNWYLSPDTGFNRLQSDVAELADPMRLLSKVNPVLRVPVEVLGNRKLYNAVPFSQKPQEVTGGPAQPLIEALLSLAGQTQQTAGGETVVNPKWNYAIQSLIPTLAQGERLIPATDDYQAKQLGSWLGYFGVPLKQVTPQMRESEYNRRMREMEQMQRAASMLGYTTQ